MRHFSVSPIKWIYERGQAIRMYVSNMLMRMTNNPRGVVM